MGHHHHRDDRHGSKRDLRGAPPPASVPGALGGIGALLGNPGGLLGGIKFDTNTVLTIIIAFAIIVFLLNLF